MEAVALNFADDMDAKLEIFTEIADQYTSKDWLGYNRILNSNIRLTRGSEYNDRTTIEEGEGRLYLKKNDVVTITITDMDEKGQGIGKADGFTLFVKDAVVGDVVETKVMKAKTNYAFAKLDENNYAFSRPN